MVSKVGLEIVHPQPINITEGATKSHPTRADEAVGGEHPLRTPKEKLRLQWHQIMLPSKE